MPTGLELKDEIEFQEAEWKFQKWVWGALTCFLIAGALGFFGNGPLATQTIELERLTLEHNRVSLIRTPAVLKLEFKDIKTKTLRVVISKEFFNHVQVTYLNPEPEKTELTADGIAYIYNTHLHTDEGSVSPVISISYKPWEMGLLHTEIHWAGSDGVAGHASFDQFIFP